MAVGGAGEYRDGCHHAHVRPALRGRAQHLRHGRYQGIVLKCIMYIYHTCKLIYFAISCFWLFLTIIPVLDHTLIKYNKYIRVDTLEYILCSGWDSLEVICKIC